jgi:hypothetical protein
MSDFQGMVKHVGVLNNTGKNVVVVFMRLPGDPNHALVIDTDALPDQYNEAVRKVVESVEGQQSKNLADVLGRRPCPDGSNMTLLQKFHSADRLEKVPVNLVIMTPRRGVRWPLVEVLKAMDITTADEPTGFDELDPETRAAVAADLQRFNVHANNMQGEASANAKEQAVSLVRQAELMEADAHNMRLKAYRIDPNLAPKVKAPKLEASYQPTEIVDDYPVSLSIDSKPKKIIESKKPSSSKPAAAKKPAAKKVSG